MEKEIRTDREIWSYMLPSETYEQVTARIEAGVKSDTEEGMVQFLEYNIKWEQDCAEKIRTDLNEKTTYRRYFPVEKALSDIDRHLKAADEFANASVVGGKISVIIVSEKKLPDLLEKKKADTAKGLIESDDNEQSTAD